MDDREYLIPPVSSRPSRAEVEKLLWTEPPNVYIDWRSVTRPVLDPAELGRIRTGEVKFQKEEDSSVFLWSFEEDDAMDFERIHSFFTDFGVEALTFGRGIQFVKRYPEVLQDGSLLILNSCEVLNNEEVVAVLTMKEGKPGLICAPKNGPWDGKWRIPARFVP